MSETQLVKNNILTKIVYKNSVFVLYNSSSDIMGQINIIDIINYIINSIQSELLLDKTYEIITKYIFVIQNKSIVFNSENSPFTTDIEIMIKLYKLLDNYMTTKLTAYLEQRNMDSNVNTKIVNMVKQLLYILANNILKLCIYIQNNMKDNKELKDKLVEYSIYFNYRISNIIKEEFKNKLNDVKKTVDNLSNVLSLKKNLEEKIISLTTIVEEQNKLLKNI
jgi:hypothetical protein